MELMTTQQTMSSREISVMTYKRHSDVLEAIRNMEQSWQKVTGRKFPLSEYTDPTGRKLPEYKLTKTECLYVATKFNDEARARLIIRWEELENQHQIPSTLSEALRLAANQAEQIEEQQRLIKQQEPKALFADAVTASKNTVLVRELAKYLNQNGIDIGQNRLFEWLRTNGYLIRAKGDDWNTPTQRAIDMGLFEVSKSSITHSDGYTQVKTTTKVTGKGQQYFVNKFIVNGHIHQSNTEISTRKFHEA